jgi:hypothetical protein
LVENREEFGGEQGGVWWRTGRNLVENREERSRHKQMGDMAAKRKAWVSTNDSSVHRCYEEDD